MSFKDYWKKKAAKRRKSWAGKDKRFADQHTQMEDIRKMVYLPLDKGVNFSFEDYKPMHFTKTNPIVCWQDMNFCFSEEGLRAALEAEGADMSSFRMEVSCQTIKGKEAPQPENRWLKRMYEICTDVETVHLSYGQITMYIKRYSTGGMPFGYYELNPCEQLTKSAMLLQETDFYTLNVATLLMEAAAEWELRQEEFNYYAKKLKIRTMEAVTTDSIEFELRDEKELQKIIQEYIKKDYTIHGKVTDEEGKPPMYTLGRIIEQVIRPWKMATKKYIDAATERHLGDKSNTFESFSTRRAYSARYRFVEEVFRPYLASVNMQDVKIEVSNEDNTDFTLKYQGGQSRLKSNNGGIFLSPSDGIFLFPYYFCDDYSIKLLEVTSLSVVTDYLKVMPAVNQKLEETILKVLHIYDQQMMQNSEYRAAVEHLEALAKQYAGKPVGKMMKYLRWNAGILCAAKFSPTKFNITDDTVFSFKKNFVDSWGRDKGCCQVYIFDPATTDFRACNHDVLMSAAVAEDWFDANRQGIITPACYLTIEDFVKNPAMVTYSRFFSSRHTDPFLSIDFIDQKL